MFVACPECHLPYNVSTYAPGQRLRCRCGQIVVVPKAGILPRPVRMLHCASCGGPLENAGRNCSYCGALIDPTAKRMNAYCPHCLAMSPDDARYCCGCGEPLVKVLEEPKTAPDRCPRCTVAMRRRALASHHPLECPLCLGVFLDGDEFIAIFTDQQRRRETARHPSGPESARLAFEDVRYLPCPSCEQPMNRVNYDKRSGVIIDYCAEHGYWFDAGEIEKVYRWVMTGGTVVQYAADSKSKREGKRRFTLKPEPERRERPSASGAEETEALQDKSLLDIFILTLLGK
jgi:Zn-finger nucleic acid-binding protein